MKSLLLLRHAKSAWSDASLADHDRPLNGRGERSARLMARHLIARCPRPDLILCSTATRTRQTLTGLIELLPPPVPPIALEEGLYLASRERLLERLWAVPDDVQTALLIGHNDGIWQLAEALAGRGKPSLLAALRTKFPTGALALLRTPIEAWRDLEPGQAELRAFVRPRDLDDHGAK